jgi:uncharacterized membrane protein YfcA
MSPLLIAALGLLMVATAFLSGLFGMAGGLAAIAVAASMLGTTLARRILEAMSDTQFRTWANRLITTVAGYYIIHGGWLLFARSLAASF